MRLLRKVGRTAFYLVGEIDEKAACEKIRAAHPGCSIDAPLREGGLVILRVERREGPPPVETPPLAMARVELRRNPSA